MPKFKDLPRTLQKEIMSLFPELVFDQEQDLDLPLPYRTSNATSNMLGGTIVVEDATTTTANAASTHTYSSIGNALILLIDIMTKQKQSPLIVHTILSLKNNYFRREILGKLLKAGINFNVEPSLITYFTAAFDPEILRTFLQHRDVDVTMRDTYEKSILENYFQFYTGTRHFAVAVGGFGGGHAYKCPITEFARSDGFIPPFIEDILPVLAQHFYKIEIKAKEDKFRADLKFSFDVAQSNTLQTGNFDDNNITSVLDAFIDLSDVMLLGLEKYARGPAYTSEFWKKFIVFGRYWYGKENERLLKEETEKIQASLHKKVMDQEATITSLFKKIYEQNVTIQNHASKIEGLTTTVTVMGDEFQKMREFMQKMGSSAITKTENSAVTNASAMPDNIVQTDSSKPTEILYQQKLHVNAENNTVLTASTPVTSDTSVSMSASML